MNTFGQHLLVEYHGCPSGLLDDQEFIQSLMKKAAEAANTTIVQLAFHRFSPQGVSGVVVIQESHLSIHTWPEAGYAAVDFYTCGDGEPHGAHQVLFEGLQAQRVEWMTIHRGLANKDNSLQIINHQTQTKTHPKADT